MKMNSRDRVLTSLNHYEPDRIPFDLGGTTVTGIHVKAYQKLRDLLGLPIREPSVFYHDIQLVDIDEDLADHLKIDCQCVTTNSWGFIKPDISFHGEEKTYTNEWGLKWRWDKHGNSIFMLDDYPLKNADRLSDIKKFNWPSPLAKHHFSGFKEKAKAAHDKGKTVIFPYGICVGPNEMHAWLRGLPKYFLDLKTNPEMTTVLMDIILDIKIAHYEQALKEAGEYIDIVMEADDFSHREQQLLTTDLYRQWVKPRHKKLFEFIKSQASVKIFLHCDGPVTPVIQDFIDVGVDIINPVDHSEIGMDIPRIKREYGKEISFWGGGVNREILMSGQPNEVRDDVKRNIDILAPGGGFIFSTIHNIWANTPPENIMAMWEALQENSQY
jgi:uroporphyrinogen decarboxylase